MLAQILPGFRDFRTPLVTGYLWLTVIWVIAGSPLPDTESETGVMGAINAIVTFLSPAIFLTVMSFVAYLIGIILVQSRTSFIVRKSTSLQARFLKRDSAVSFQDRIRRIVIQVIRRAFQNKVTPAMVMHEFGYKLYEDENALREHEIETDFDDWQMDQNDRHRVEHFLPRKIAPQIVESIPSLAIKLHEQSADLFDKYDRQRTEVEFRFSIALPIAVLSIVILLKFWGQPFFGLPLMAIAGGVASIILVWKGVEQNKMTDDLLITALEVGAVQSTELERIRSIQP